MAILHCILTLALVAAVTVSSSAFGQAADAPATDQPTEPKTEATSPDAPSADSGPADATAEPAKPVGILPTPDYSGKLRLRSTLTGDWNGVRQEWAEKGFTIDAYLTQVGMGVVSGGRDEGWKYLGRGELALTLDTGKAGLWPGGLVNVTAEGHFGNPVSIQHAGSLIPVNLNEALPEADNSFVIPQYTYTQFLSQKFGVIMGKLVTITHTSGDMNEFAHGKGDFLFLNTNFNANPVILLTVPYSTYGAGAIILPTKDLSLTALVIDSHGQADSAQLDSMFSNGATFVVEGRYTTKFFKKTGHQLLGATYATSSYTDLDQSVADLIIPGLPTQEADYSWSVYYNFDQYFYQPDSTVDKGIGVFGRAGFSDGKANPIDWTTSVGLGGKGMIPNRPNDSFGIGYYYTGIADTEITSTLGFDDSHGAEAFYNIGITPWLHVTPDVQWIHPSQDSVDDSWILGLRAVITF